MEFLCCQGLISGYSVYMDQMWNCFIAKCENYSQTNLKDIKIIWEKELKFEATRIFTLISLNESVFAKLDAIRGSNRYAASHNQRKSKKSLNDSSGGSIGNRLKSISLTGSSVDLSEKLVSNNTIFCT